MTASQNQQQEKEDQRMYLFAKQKLIGENKQRVILNVNKNQSQYLNLEKFLNNMDHLI